MELKLLDIVKIGKCHFCCTTSFEKAHNFQIPKDLQDKFNKVFQYEQMKLINGTGCYSIARKLFAEMLLKGASTYMHRTMDSHSQTIKSLVFLFKKLNSDLNLFKIEEWKDDSQKDRVKHFQMYSTEFYLRLTRC